MQITRLTETDIYVLQAIADKTGMNQQEISIMTNIPEPTVSRVVRRLGRLLLIIDDRVYHSNCWRINRNKSNEVIRVLTLFERCKSAILNQSQTLLNVHGIQITASAYVPKDYEREGLHPYFTLYRKGVSIYLPQATVNIIISEIDSAANTAQVLLQPFYLVLETKDASNAEYLERVVRNEVYAIYESLRASITRWKIDLTEIKEISDYSLAIQDDWLPRLAIKSGQNKLFYPFIDDSRKTGNGEFEFTGEKAFQVISSSIALRMLCADKNLSEPQIMTAVNAYHATIGSPIPYFDSNANSGVMS